MEHRRVHPQQLTHGAHDSSSFDIFHSPLYSTFPDILGGGSKATQPPHPSPQYVQQQQYAPDNGSPLEVQRSPQRPYCPQGRPQQGHSHIGNPAQPLALQQPQPRPAAAHPMFPQDHEGYNPSLQAHYLPLSRAVPHQNSHISNEPSFLNPFTDNACPQTRGDITRLSDFTYVCHPQPRYSLPTMLPSAATHTPPEHSPSTSVQGPPSAFHEQHDNGTNTDTASQRTRSWGGAGSLDPTTGVFSRAADHPRIRTAQACEKCRARKAKVRSLLSRHHHHELSDKTLYGLRIYSVQASTRHASGAKHGDCPAPTRQSAACAGLTSRSLRPPSIQTDRSPRPRKRRKLANGPPPCPLPHAGDH